MESVHGMAMDLATTQFTSSSVKKPQGAASRLLAWKKLGTD